MEEQDTRVELTEERVREIVREEIAAFGKALGASFRQAKSQGGRYRVAQSSPSTQPELGKGLSQVEATAPE